MADLAEKSGDSWLKDYLLYTLHAAILPAAQFNFLLQAELQFALPVGLKFPFEMKNHLDSFFSTKCQDTFGARYWNKENK